MKAMKALKAMKAVKQMTSMKAVKASPSNDPTVIKAMKPRPAMKTKHVMKAVQEKRPMLPFYNGKAYREWGLWARDDPSWKYRLRDD
jgi:hypothetical protein